GNVRCRALRGRRGAAPGPRFHWGADLAGTTGAGYTLRRTLLVTRLGLWGIVGEDVVPVWRERRVVATLDRDVLHHHTGDLANLVEARLYQVDRHRRVAKGAGLLLALTHRVVGESAERLALVGVEPSLDLCGQDHVRVGRERICA